jgi:hypothetical protein
VRKMRDTDTDWLAAAQQLAGRDLAPRKEITLRYALGKYFNDVGDFEQAFCNYRRANELGRDCGRKYDAQREELAGELMSRVYDHEWVNRGRAGANRSTRPVFIVGMPRSGTSLAEQIVASHRSAHGAGELPFWRNASMAHDMALLKGEDGDAVLAGLADAYLARLNGFSTEALRVVDKMPGNFLNLGLIFAAFPNARIIHMQRNPVDTCLSIFFQHFNATHSYAHDLGDLAHYYTEYFHLMGHWRSVLPKHAILDVPYEGLVDDQEGWSRKMISFLGLPWDERCLDFHECARTVSTASNWQVRQKMNKGSVERWRNYAAYVGPLLPLLDLGTAAQMDMVERETATDSNAGPQLLGNLLRRVERRGSDRRPAEQAWWFGADGRHERRVAALAAK